MKNMVGMSRHKELLLNKEVHRKMDEQFVRNSVRGTSAEGYHGNMYYQRS